MHAIRHWNHQDLPSTVIPLNYLRQLFRHYMTTLGCTVPLPLDKSTASPCEILKHQRTIPTCIRKTNVTPVPNDHFDHQRFQLDGDTKAAAMQYDWRYSKKRTSPSVQHSRNAEREESLRIFLKFLNVTPWT